MTREPVDIPGSHPAPDPVRERLREALWQRGLSLAEASLAIGRNKAYLQQYLARGMPRVLSFQDSEALAALLGCEAADLRHDALPAPKPWKKKLPGGARPRMRGVAEMEVEAAAGPGAWNDGFVMEKSRWQLPEAMIRHEGDADPESLRIIRVRGNSMEPELGEGDRLVVDTGRQVPGAGELYVLWDGDGLVVKRVEPVHRTGRGTGAPALRLISVSPDYPDYECRAEDIHIVGKVLWKVTRA